MTSQAPSSLTETVMHAQDLHLGASRKDKPVTKAAKSALLGPVQKGGLSASFEVIDHHHDQHALHRHHSEGHEIK